MMATHRTWIGMMVALGTTMLGTASLDGCGDDTILTTRDASSTDATVDVSIAPVDSGAADAGSSDASFDAAETSCQLDAGPLDDAAVQQGIALVKQYKCQTCHGQILSGNNNGVPNGSGGVSYPPNLTPDPETGLGCWSTDLVTRAILTGVDDEGRSLCPPMPKFADAGLDQAGATAIATFLRSLTPQTNTVPDTSCGDQGDGGDAGDDGGDAGADSGM